MTDKTYKILLFMKRRPGMTMDDFRDYYENHHVRFGEESSRGITRYIRRYIDPMPNPETGDDSELPYDVITELWFDDRAMFEGTVKFLSTTVMSDEVIDDEKNLFDRSKNRMATVAEYESDLNKPR